MGPTWRTGCRQNESCGKRTNLIWLQIATQPEL